MKAKPEPASAEAISELTLVHNISLSTHAASDPLIYLIHGRAGNVNVMWLFRRVLPDNVHIISIQAPIEDEIGGYSWWPVGGNKDEEYQIALTSAQKAANFMRLAPDYYGIHPSKTFAFGFSQGSGLMSLLVQEGHVSFDAIAILAGFIMKRTDAASPKWPEVFWGHGTLDETIPIERARRDRDRLLLEGANVEFQEEEVGHKIGSQTMKSLGEWIAKQCSH